MKLRIRIFALSIVMVLGITLAACTPEQIQQLESGGFDSGGFESALFGAGQIAAAVPVIGSRLGIGGF